VAQLGARLDGIEEVVGSNPIGSTNRKNSNRRPPFAVVLRIQYSQGIEWGRGFVKGSIGIRSTRGLKTERTEKFSEEQRGPFRVALQNVLQFG
jgi:hypothetical protein